MPGEEKPSQERKRTNRRSRYKPVAIAGLGVLASLLILRAILPTAQKQLAAIDEARAVRDEDNAALIYAELLRGAQVPPDDLGSTLVPFMEAMMDPVSLQQGRVLNRKLVELEPPEEVLDPNDEDVTFSQSWESTEYPELRQWLDQHQDRIERLLEAARKPACHFPLRPEPNDMGLLDVPLSALRQNASLLLRVANNDMGEGNIAAGLAKYQALTSIGRHFQTQPSEYVLLTGIVWEAVGLHHLAEFIATGPATDRHLDALATEAGDLEDRWESVSQNVSHVRDVLARTLKDRRRLDIRIYTAYRRIRYKEEAWTGRARAGDLYRRVLCERRGHHILIALRRFKNETGDWPNRLEETASTLAPLALIDPQNGDAYVYRRTEDGFRLYSKGPNGKNENGRRWARGPDDWPIWPPLR